MLNSPSTPGLDYLECPTCGARYVLREPLDGKRRWFDCARCHKRVRSATPYWLGDIAIQLPRAS